MATKRKPEIQWPDPPEHLSEWSKERWRRYVGTKVKSPGGIDLLRVALESFDTAEQCRVQIEGDGLLVGDGKMSHSHPLLRVQRENRQMFAKLWKELCLHHNQTSDELLESFSAELEI